jgi:hypothetical protein
MNMTTEEEEKRKYKKIMSQLYIGMKVIYRDKIKTITDISLCEHQGKSGLSCNLCIGRISLDGNPPCCYSSSYNFYIFLMEEEFLSEKEFEL